MPVNRTPKKRRRQDDPSQSQDHAPKREFGEETELDREKDVADAEWKNMWDQTEVINMDEF
ncbi:hypothetical protein YTPLAS18_17690 [Nitrospira sp.]|nr:hypothetical protein YTPLAS18_17690 [Nitrospira sp.]